MPYVDINPHKGRPEWQGYAVLAFSWSSPQPWWLPRSAASELDFVPRPVDLLFVPVLENLVPRRPGGQTCPIRQIRMHVPT